MARNFYKKDGSYYYADNNQKILNIAELQAAAQAGGKEVSIPQQGNIPTQQSSGMPQHLVDKLKQAFGRTPTQTDIANWQYNPAVFENQLNQAIGNKQPGQTPAQNAPQLQSLEDELINHINSLNLSEGEKAVLRELAFGEYTSGQKVPSEQEIQQMIRDAAVNAERDISPYYQTLTAREIEDFKNQLGDIRQGFERYQEQEAKDYKTRLKETKDNLRQRGLTFSGASRQTLGKEGALQSRGIEGDVPQQRRLDFEQTADQFETQGRQLGTAAERKLGSSALTGMNFGQFTTPYGQRTLYNPMGNIQTGDLELDRLRAIEQSKWDRVKDQSLFYFN